MTISGVIELEKIFRGEGKADIYYTVETTDTLEGKTIVTSVLELYAMAQANQGESTVRLDLLTAYDADMDEVKRALGEDLDECNAGYQARCRYEGGEISKSEYQRMMAALR